MRDRSAAGWIAVLLFLAAPAGALAEGADPETIPDFSGIWARAPEIDFYPVPGEEAKPVAKIPLDHPDAEEIIAGDWTNPILRPWAREIVKANAESEMRLVHIYEADDSCWPVPPPQILNLREAVQFLQDKDRVTILYQRDHLVRRIWLNQAHSPDVKPSWHGESVGHYEGDTLVVDTVGIKVHPMSKTDNYGTPHTEKLHVVERYRLIEDERGKAIEFVVLVEDEGAFTMPWKAMGRYRPTGATSISEVACAENNRSFADGTHFGVIPEEKNSPF